VQASDEQEKELADFREMHSTERL